MKLSGVLVVVALLVPLSACTETGPEAEPVARSATSAQAEGTPVEDVLGLTTAELIEDHEYVASIQGVSQGVLRTRNEPAEVDPDSAAWTIVAACSASGVLEKGQATLGAVPTAMVTPEMRERIVAGDYQRTSGLC